MTAEHNLLLTDFIISVEYDHNGLLTSVQPSDIDLKFMLTG